MQLKIFDIGIAKEWFGTSGDFLKICFKPGGGAPSDDPAVCTKWMVSGMWALILSYLINIGYWFLAGFVVTGVTAFVQNAIFAFLQTWVFWFAFIKREPSCCYLFVVCIEDFKPMHLIAGILVLLSGVLQVLSAVQGLIPYLSQITEPVYLVYTVYVVFILLYAITQVAVGLCLIKIGGKKAGVDVPGADKVGA
jgi:hypothetical protein